MELVSRRVDVQGRISLPSSWRREALQGCQEVVIIKREDHLIVRPKIDSDLTKFFDAFEVKVSPETFMDYKKLRKALLGSLRP